MATSTLHRQQQQTNTWSTIFPNEQVTQQQSALFVKKLLAVAISNITYLRTIFPEHAFGDRCLEDLNLKILRDDSACPGACQVIQWVKGCFDALDKKYLRTIVIGIYEDSNNPSAVVETYTFKFEYNKEQGVTIFRNGSKLAGAYTESETRKATIKLLRTIVVLTQTLKPLPDDVMMTMKLYYYDNVTPPDYEPPGFQAAAADDFSFRDDPLNIRVGDVETPFHTVKLRIRTDCQQFSICEEREEQEQEEEEEEESSSQEQTERQKKGRGEGRREGGSQEPHHPSYEHMDTDSHSQGHRRPERPTLPKEAHAATGDSQGRAKEPSTKSSARAPDPPPPLPKKHTSTTSSITPHLPQPMEVEEKEGGRKGRGPERGEKEEEEKKGVEDNTVRCPCGCNEDDGLMVLCAMCKVWQHAVCFALLSEEDVPETHICVQCSQSDSEGNQRCTDPFLQFLNPVTLQATCLWRRALQASVEFNRVIAPIFARRLGVEVSVSQGLINRLEKEGFVRSAMKNKRLGRIVNKDRVRSVGMRKYFEKVREEAKALGKTGPQAKEGVARDESVESIINGASSMDIRSDGPHQPQVAVVQQEETEGARRSPRIVAKRVRAAMDQSLEFEISNSQDLDTCEDSSESRRKRRKASIASRSILV